MKTQTFAKSGHELNSSSQGSVIIPSQRPKFTKAENPKW